MTDRLFVYGTLVPGRVNDHELAAIRGTWAHATVRGHLHPEGWGAAAGYPGLILDDTATEVTGMVLTSEELDDHWPRLDEFEGEGYARVVTEVTLADGTTVAAQLYVLSEIPG